MLALLIVALLAADPDDHLVPEKGHDEPYETTVANLLLTRIDRELEMLTIPSFRAEEAVFVTVTGGKATVVAVRAKPQVWAAMMALHEAEADGGSYIIGGAADAKALEKLKFDREISTAPISTPTVEAIRRVWHRALQEVRPPTSRDFGLDGETHHFAESSGAAGQVWTPDEKSRMGRLVALGTAMLELARAPAEKRAALDAALRKQAEAWLR